MENMEGLIGKKILVTGGAGFIGSHLVEALINSKAKVIVVDILIDPKSYFAQNKFKNKTKFELADIRDIKRLDRVFKKHQPDFIFHLAAEPIVEEAFLSPVSTFETNIMGTVNVLESARKLKRLTGIIVASSDKAYGKTKKAYSEESPLQGDHPYDVSKSSADLISTTYYKTYNLPVSITRFGNVYGEGDLHFDRIIPGICKAVVNKSVLKIRSDGSYIRDYLYVKDVVNGYLFLLRNFKKARGEAFNFSSDDTLSVLDLLKKTEKILGRKIPYKILNISKNEIPYQHLNDSKIRKLGWRSSFSIKLSLNDVRKWYEKEILSSL